MLRQAHNGRIQMTTDLQKRIYQAQCIGNVEPIEYMIPYPNTHALIEGQNIKFAEQVIYEQGDITNRILYELIQQTAHWLDSLNIKPRERVIIHDLGFPQTEILLFGIWHLGASAVILESLDIDNAKQSCSTEHLIEPDTDLLKAIEPFPTDFDPKYKALLGDEALVSCSRERGIRLSHYNLLANTNSVQKAIDIKSRTRIFCDLQPDSTSWVVLKAILPIYCGCIFTDKKADITISDKDQNSTFYMRKDLKNLAQFKDNHLAICPENTAVLSRGTSPIHLTDLTLEENTLAIRGHSVMMGYLNDSKNELSFRNKTLYIPI